MRRSNISSCYPEIDDTQYQSSAVNPSEQSKMSLLSRILTQCPFVSDFVFSAKSGDTSNVLHRRSHLSRIFTLRIIFHTHICAVRTQPNQVLNVRQSPEMFQESIDELKSHLKDKIAPFGVDIKWAAVLGRQITTTQTVNVLLDIIINSGAALFVSDFNFPSVQCLCEQYTGAGADLHH
ncbi:hypothetical protein DFJ58DRAFT_91305 [Suillus subalutaceus]|uniref:uncharacterized protein n=1 Tax=Suillus subalutaceus TaxID=48586 RepID=UPI001B885804|nr:uncharacterized protein DFJ58DRAFT_91305 [Suillus subalutaceus]KAG1840473.1 hypothetical protein DFJ58DRAFT_91305 [Suillus subalutaceus]